MELGSSQSCPSKKQSLKRCNAGDSLCPIGLFDNELIKFDFLAQLF